MDYQTVGRWILVSGVLLVVVGGLMLLIGRIVGKNGLPGDIHIEAQNVSCFFPMASMIVLSVILTIVLNLLIRIINK